MKFQSLSLFLLRIAMGWTFFYAGITKVLDPKWSAAGYIKGSVMFTGFYHFLLQPHILPVVNLLNEWGLVLLGALLILGVFVRISAPLGALLMLLYYLALHFPHPDANSYIVDEHIVYLCGLLVLAATNAGRIWGLGGRLR